MDFEGQGQKVISYNLILISLIRLLKTQMGHPSAHYEVIYYKKPRSEQIDSILRKEKQTDFTGTYHQKTKEVSSWNK